MFKDKIKTQLKGTLSKIDESKKLEETEKVLYRDLLQDCAENTNGKTQEEKLQGVTESVFTIVQLLVLDKLSDSKHSMWETIVKCRWQIVIVIAVLSVLFIFQPQLAAILAKFFV